jgi:hypothetical protein
MVDKVDMVGFSDFSGYIVLGGFRGGENSTFPGFGSQTLSLLSTISTISTIETVYDTYRVINC